MLDIKQQQIDGGAWLDFLCIFRLEYLKISDPVALSDLLVVLAHEVQLSLDL